jgi:hypothetical protein
MSSKPAICFPDKQAIENLETWETLQPFDETKPLRGNHTQLLISYQQPDKPVTTYTNARWLKTVIIIGFIIHL